MAKADNELFIGTMILLYFLHEWHISREEWNRMMHSITHNAGNLEFLVFWKRRQHLALLHGNTKQSGSSKAKPKPTPLVPTEEPFVKRPTKKQRRVSLSLNAQRPPKTKAKRRRKSKREATIVPTEDEAIDNLKRTAIAVLFK